MTLRTALRAALAAAAGAAACLGAASATTITLDAATLSSAPVLSGTVDGTRVTASAATWTYGTWDAASRTGTGAIDLFGPEDAATLTMTRGHGLALRNSPWDRNHQIDGSGRLDLVVLEFGRSVTLEGLGFGYVDRNDDFVLFAGDTLDDLVAYSAMDVASRVSLAVTGRVFGIGALGGNDDFKLTAIQFDAAAVPVPAAAPLFAGALVLASAARRRRKA